MHFDIVQGVPFRSKEVSWLSFNSRVLQEAADETVPLLERLKFLGIYSSNLDEFFRVRVATLKRLVLLGKDYKKLNIPHPGKTLDEVESIVKHETDIFNKTYANVMKGLHANGISVIDETQVPKDLHGWLLDYFERKVRPRIMPIMIKSYSRLSRLRDNPMYLAVEMWRAESKSREAHALIEIPSSELPRFLVLPEHKGKILVMFLDDVIRFGLPSIFHGLPYERFHAWAVKFTRDAEMDFDDDFTESLYDKIAEGLKARETGMPVRMNYDASIPPAFLKLLLRKLKLAEEDTLFPGARYHNRKDLIKFPRLGAPELSRPTEKCLAHHQTRKSQASLFKAMRKQDMLLHFPYHSFSTFLDLLREASLDPLVQSIYITQYRVARQSCVAKALMNAVTNGKQVVVLVEPRARFDEKNNIEWANLYQEAGVRVLLGIPTIKVHAKLCCIVRSEGREDACYSAVGTGNFNEDTSEIYTDHMLLTANQEIGQDILSIFKFFTNTYQPPRLTHLVAAPFHLRHTVKFWIQNEITNAKQGKRAEIFIKINNISDVEIVEQLYKASEAGVQVRIICRSMFSVVTGEPKWSQNIQARGIIDQYLEHSRVLTFANGGNPKVFLSSADFLPRNFDSRFEILCPVYHPALQKELKHYMELQWSDNTKARILDRG